MNDNTGMTVFHDDNIEFEPYSTLHKNYMHWFVPYMQEVFKSQSIRKVIDKRLHKRYLKNFSSLTQMDELTELINAMSRNGFKGPKSYFNANKKFYYFLIENNQDSLKRINTNMFKHFLLNELEVLAYSSKRNIYVAIKNFLTFIENRNYTNNGKDEHNFKLHNDIAKVLGKERKQIAYLSPKTEYYSFLESIKKVPWSEKIKHRNCLMLKILLITGIRVAELTSIKTVDVSIKKEYDRVEIKIIGKGNKKRVVSLAYSLIKEELDFTINNSVHVINSKFLFSTVSGKSVNDRYLNTLVSQVMIVANIAPKEKNGPHMLRHSCATWLYVTAGFDIAKLQAYMAHEDISTTKKYTHINDEVVKEISSQANEILGKNYKEYLNK